MLLVPGMAVLLAVQDWVALVCAPPVGQTELQTEYVSYHWPSELVPSVPVLVLPMPSPFGLPMDIESDIEIPDWLIGSPSWSTTWRVTIRWYPAYPAVHGGS